MSVRFLCTVALCVTLFTHVCLCAIPQRVIGELEEEEKSILINKAVEEFKGKDVSKEETLHGNLSQEGIEFESNEQQTNRKSTEITKESNSIEKGPDKKHDSSLLSSSSSESSSSEEEKIQGKSKGESQNKNRQKRELDSNQGSLNKLGTGAEDTLNNDDSESSVPTANEDATTPILESDRATTTKADEVAESDTTPAADVTSSEINNNTPLDTISTTESSKDSDSEVEGSDGETVSSSISPENKTSTNSEEQSFTKMAMDRVDKLSDQIRKILYHYRKEGVVILPGKSFFPEPMAMEEFEKSFSIGRMRFKDVKVYGLSNFTVEHINTDIDRMQVYILLKMKKLVILGNNTLSTFWSRSAGPFNVTLLDVDSEGVAEIVTTPEGHLEATDSDMNMDTKEMLVNFTNLGVGNVFISAIGNAVFNSIKPQILDKVNLVIRNDVNKKLKDLSVKFINKVAPIDLAFSEGRKYVREHGYDPFAIGNQSFPIGGILIINITDFNVKGLSKFNRVGDLSLSMDSGVIEFGIHVLTQKLTGDCKWSASFFGMSKSGKTNFTVDHLQVRALVNQSLDLRQKPQLEDLDLELGWVRVTMDSPMTLSTVVEGVINAFPKLIRHMIVDTIEQPLKGKIQEILNHVNVESFVEDNLPQLDNFGL